MFAAARITLQHHFRCTTSKAASLSSLPSLHTRHPAIKPRPAASFPACTPKPFKLQIGNYSTMSSKLPLFKDLTAPNGHKINQPLGLFINNEFVPSKSGSTLQSITPIDDSLITEVYAAESADVDAAAEAARAAFNNPEWSDLEPSARGRLLYKLADLIEENKETLAVLDTWDMGKPISVTRDEDLVETISSFRYYAGWSDKINGKTLNVGPSKLVYTVHHPIGVCGQIIPWNYPLSMAAWKLGPALATGNTVVLKSAEQSPLSVLYLGKLIKEAGFPAGVVNILSGYGRTAGAAIAAHTGIDKIAFTGSTNTAKEIMKAAAVNLKNITLETGGKSPLVIFEDADLEQAVKWGHIGIMSNSGQVCCATSRILIHESIYDKYIEMFQKHTEKFSVVGNPFKETTSHGPQVSKQQYERVMQYVQKGKDEGAVLVQGGEPAVPGGNFVLPTLFKDVEDHHTIFQEEVFGPFVVFGKFKTQEEAIKRANCTQYGLGAAIFTKNIARAHKVASKIDSGMVWINSSNDSHVLVPFGGVKQSGFGRECGEYALDNYTNIKAVFVDLSDA